MKSLFRILFLFGCTLLITGCGEHMQSVIDPQSVEAEAIARLWWVMAIIGGLVFVAVIVFMFQAIFSKTGAAPPGGSMRFVWVGGIIFPAIVLVGILIYSLRVTLVNPPPEDGLTIDVIGRLWWWEVRYPDAGIVTANEIHIPAGEQVKFRLTSGDVIHSFWVPNLHGKMDMFPGQTTTIWMGSRKPGVWRGQCAEFCGTQHAWMAFEVVVHEPAEYEEWVAARKAAAATTRMEALAHGESIFFEHGCQNCHAIQGTDAISNIGPDLTHFGNRRMIGAAVVPNDRDHLARWILDPHGIKPGNLMPATYLPSEDLDVLVDYLFSLDDQP